MTLPRAYIRYWSTSNPAQERAAYYEILLKGGKDDYPNVGKYRQWAARKLRQLAAWVDKFDR
jgi:hypothetical protein